MNDVSESLTDNEVDFLRMTERVVMRELLRHRGDKTTGSLSFEFVAVLEGGGVRRRKNKVTLEGAEEK